MHVRKKACTLAVKCKVKFSSFKMAATVEMVASQANIHPSNEG